MAPAVVLPNRRYKKRVAPGEARCRTLPQTPPPCEAKLHSSAHSKVQLGNEKLDCVFSWDGCSCVAWRQRGVDAQRSLPHPLPNLLPAFLQDEFARELFREAHERLGRGGDFEDEPG